MKTRILVRLLPVLLAVSLIPAEVPAADHYTLEDGLPTELADAIPIKYRNTEAQGLARWEHTGEGEEKFLLVPRLEYGLWLNTQVSVDAPYEVGEAVNDDEFKTVGLELLYNSTRRGSPFRQWHWPPRRISLSATRKTGSTAPSS